MTSVLCVNRNYICNSTGGPGLHDRTCPGSFPKYSLITLEWEFSVSGKQLQKWWLTGCWNFKQLISVPCTNHYFDGFFYVNILTAELHGLFKTLTHNCPVIYEWVLERHTAEPSVGGASLSTHDTEVSGWWCLRNGALTAWISSATNSSLTLGNLVFGPEILSWRRL